MNDKTAAMEKFLEAARERNKPKDPAYFIGRFHDDVNAYISSKYPDIPEHVILDISTYAANRMTVNMTDALWERDREWKKHLDGETRRLQRTKRGVKKEETDERGTEK